jgi:hypothetical protein
MPAGTYSEHFLLNYLLVGDTATRIIAWSVGLSTISTPTDAVLGEFTDASYTRQAGHFASVNANTFTNTAAISFGTFQTLKTAQAVLIFDSTTHLLLYGSLAAASSVRAGTDSASFAIGSLLVVLS